MSAVNDLTGRQFGKWTVLRWHPKGTEGNMRWECRCACGRVYFVSGIKLKIGRSKCCRHCRHFIHGLGGRKTATYRSWVHMRRRCLAATNIDFKHYGGRGIKICKRWNSFINFLADMGEKPAGLTLERIDNNGDYCPSNCRWATQREQTRNQRRNRAVTFKGRTQSLADWCDELQLPYQRISRRLRRGWSVEASLK